MATFTYRARKSPAEIIEGVLEAESEGIALVRLKEIGYFPISIEERKEDAAKILQRFKSIRPKDVMLFNRQLSNLLDAGIPLVKSLSILIGQTENPRMAKLVEDLRNNIQKGVSFSESLAKYPRIFSPVQVSMVHAGEVGGMLNQVLQRLADFSENQEEVKGKIKGAMTYPLFLFLVGIITIFVLLTFVLPRFVVMFRDLGQSLPLPTRILIGFSSFMSNYWWLLLFGIILLFFILKRMFSAPQGKTAFDGFRLRIPLLGKIVRKVDISAFTRTLGTLLENGIAILPAIQTAKSTVRNQVIGQQISTAQEEVTKGSKLAEALSKSPHFFPLEINMIAIGEESGNLEEMLFKIASGYEKEVDRSVKALTSLLEPIMIIILGAFVGFIVFSILLPIFQVNVLIR
ncbi:MAG: type II secretion system F family protein [Candidatus Ratteibacteria bacterium]|jgi:type II secretion system protein F